MIVLKAVKEFVESRLDTVVKNSVVSMRTVQHDRKCIWIKRGWLHKAFGHIGDCPIEYCRKAIESKNEW